MKKFDESFYNRNKTIEHTKDNNISYNPFPNQQQNINPNSNIFMSPIPTSTHNTA